MDDDTVRKTRRARGRAVGWRRNPNVVSVQVSCRHLLDAIISSGMYDMRSRRRGYGALMSDIIRDHYRQLVREGLIRPLPMDVPTEEESDDVE